MGVLAVYTKWLLDGRDMRGGGGCGMRGELRSAGPEATTGM
jgi:hypothetical protein